MVLKKLGVEVTVLDEAAMRELGMGALLAVGQGSVRGSRTVIMRWRGAESAKVSTRSKSKPIAFVGKGVCFDTGGISIKPAAGMEDMKGDMAGAACVVGLMQALAGRKANVDVLGAIGLVENMPGPQAQRPGDIVKSMSGQTIEVVNTDAEGRLVLADLLWYVQDKFKPKFIIDLATLTGAILVALGQEHAGLFTNDDELGERLIAAGEATGEKLWRLPLGAAYDKMIELEVRRHEKHWRPACRLDHRRAIPPTLRQSHAMGTSGYRGHRDGFAGKRDQSKLGLWVRRPAARPAHCRSLRGGDAARRALTRAQTPRLSTAGFDNQAGERSRPKTETTNRPKHHKNRVNRPGLRLISV